MFTGCGKFPVRKHPLDVNSQVPVLKDYTMCRVLFLKYLFQTIQISTLKANLNLTSTDVLSYEQLYKYVPCRQNVKFVIRELNNCFITALN